MTSWWLAGRAGSTGVSSGVTAYWTCAGPLAQSGTESVTEMPVREAGVFNNLYIRVFTNTLNQTAVFTTRKSQADTAITLSVSAAATGVFEDTSNSASYADTDEIACKMVIAAGSGSIIVTQVAHQFEPTDTSKTVVCLAAFAAVNITSASATQYTQPCCTMAVGATEADQKWRVGAGFTSSNFYVNVNANARTTTTTFRTRVNGANGNQLVSVVAAATGIFEDTSNSDTLADGDDYNYSWTTGTGTETMTIVTIASKVTSANGQFPLITGVTAGVATGVGTTTYVPANGRYEVNNNEIRSKAQPRFTFDVTKLSALISANTLSANATIRVRDDGANGNNLLTITASTPGLYQDTTNSDTITSGTDDVNYQIATGAGSGSMTVRWISVIATNPVAPPGGDTPQRMLTGVGT